MTFSFVSGEHWRLRLYLILQYLTYNELAHTVFKMSNGARSIPWRRPTITDAASHTASLIIPFLARILARSPRTIPTSRLAPRVFNSGRLGVNMPKNFSPYATHPHLSSADFIRLLPAATSADPLITHCHPWQRQTEYHTLAGQWGYPLTLANIKSPVWYSFFIAHTKQLKSKPSLISTKNFTQLLQQQQQQQLPPRQNSSGQ